MERLKNVFQGDGMLIGTGFRSHTDPSNTTVSVVLSEDGWYHIPDDVDDIPASAFASSEPDFIGRRVFKEDFMRVLGSLTRILVRAKYHTDQLEGT